VGTTQQTLANGKVPACIVNFAALTKLWPRQTIDNGKYTENREGMEDPDQR
jgi:hypothetical protein